MKATIFILVIVSAADGCVQDMLDNSTITIIQAASQAECEEDADALNAQRNLRASCMQVEVAK